MRIIGGVAGSRRIRVPNAVARPSTDRLREALFSILGPLVDGARVLDLFSGSGALGLECLSRGATSCDFVDESREAARVITSNLKTLGLDEGRVVVSDVFRFLNGGVGKYDLIFADPPYFKFPGDRDFVSELLVGDSLVSLVAPEGLVVVEDPPKNKRCAENVSPQWKLLDKRKYGGCGILFYELADKGE